MIPRHRRAERTARRPRLRRGARRRALTARQARSAASGRLRRFRQGSTLAVGVVALSLLVLGDPEGADGGGLTGFTPTAAAQEPPADAQALPIDTSGAAATDTVDTAAADPGESARRATGTLRALLRDFYNFLPILGIALGILLVAGILARLVRMGLRAVLASWERAEATAALVAILIWLLALGTALSVMAGDARALVGSVGLFGLALSWALQTPIESFTGWLLNSFRSYYRVGDRIAVGEVFGDVARIDFLTTTVFEAGGPDKPVQAAQSTGAFITFPNNEVLRSNIVNFTRDFPYVWDELTVGVANESDIPLAARVLEATANEVVGERMRSAAEEYAALLGRAGLGWDVATGPEVFAAARDAWTDLTIRYLVPAREMRRWSSRLLLAVNSALAAEDVRDRVFASYPRNQVQPIPTPEWARDETDGGARPPGPLPTGPGRS